MASMRDIKRRRESIQSTEQITKAMKLVATVKLQKAKARAEERIQAGSDDLDLKRAEISLRRAITRIQVTK